MALGAGGWRFWAVKDKRKAGRALSSAQKKRNRKQGSIRAKIEHVFRVIECQFGYRSVPYRGLAKNTAQMLTLTALANRKRCAAPTLSS
ncbi:MAG: transposase [Aliishimia sp.]